MMDKPRIILRISFHGRALFELQQVWIDKTRGTRCLKMVSVGGDALIGGDRFDMTAYDSDKLKFEFVGLEHPYE